jgi:hypothetical protein
MYSSTLSLTSALDGVGGQRQARPLYPPEMTRYPLYRRLGGPQGRSGRVLKTSPSPGFDPRTVQLVSSRYTDWAIPVPTYCRYRGLMWHLVTLRHTTLGKTPLDEGSARRRDLYLTTHNTHKRQTSMPPAGFEQAIPASERPQIRLRPHDYRDRLL